MRSLRLRLSLAVSIVVVSFAALAGVWSFIAAYDDATEIRNGELRAISGLFGANGLPMPEHMQAQFGDVSGVVVERVGGGEKRFFPLPADATDGFHTTSIEGETWRVYVRATDSSDTRVAVGQRAVAREHLALDAGLWTAVPLLVMVPVLCGLIFLLTYRMLRPIADFSGRLDRRTEQDLSPVQAVDAPSEIRPIIVAINRLLLRLGAAMEIQRRFIADAAHELRSPLAALSIQAENLGNSTGNEQRAERLASLRQGIARTRTLLDGLLTLARVRAPVQAEQGVPACDCGTVLRGVLEQLLPLADAKRVEVGVSKLEAIAVAASEIDLTLVLRNLIDNAIRYSEPGSRVDVAISARPREAIFEVIDHGPGIPESERKRVFDPFYRLHRDDETGGGLGLSIVRTIVGRLRGSIELGWTTARPPRGLKVRVVLPAEQEPGERRLAAE